jgi:integrase
VRKLTRHDRSVAVIIASPGPQKPRNPRGRVKPFSAQEVSQIDNYLLRDTSLIARRDRALFWVAVDTMLRGSDLVRLTVGHVKPGARKNIVEEFWFSQRKTNKNVYCQLSPKAQGVLAAWIDSFWEHYTPQDRLFNISDRQFRAIIKKLAEAIGLDPKRYSGHSTRRTRPTLIYAQERNLAAIRILLGHSSLGATAAYLGIEQEDAATAWRNVKLGEDL